MMATGAFLSCHCSETTLCRIFRCFFPFADKNRSERQINNGGLRVCSRPKMEQKNGPRFRGKRKNRAGNIRLNRSLSRKVSPTGWSHRISAKFCSILQKAAPFVRVFTPIFRQLHPVVQGLGGLPVSLETTRDHPSCNRRCIYSRRMFPSSKVHASIIRHFIYRLCALFQIRTQTKHLFMATYFQVFDVFFSG